METQLYMRIRGRVLGPYDQEKLQSLARRGQLSRMHELSTDGVTWVRASNFPEVFHGGPAETLSLEAQSDIKVEPSPTPNSQGASHAASGPGWYYSLGGTQLGPVEFSTLQVLSATGQLGTDDMVWTQGMLTWSPLREVPGLSVGHAGNSQNSARGRSDQNAAELVPPALLRSAVNSRLWVFFIAMLTFILATLLAVGGFFQLIAGARERFTPAVASGIFSVIAAVIATAGGVMLTMYANVLKRLEYSGKGEALERAMDILRGFWIYVSIVLIVWSAIVTVAVVWAFAAGVTVPNFYTSAD